MKETPHRKTRTGVVVSDKMQKTIVVEIATKVQHPLYKKYIRQRTKFKVHDENEECGIGDVVEIEETRPLSRQKRWRLKGIIERAS
jgi:small subunit ribosomal protein S17